MKANEAPDKLWWSKGAVWQTNPDSKRYIEYTRTDAFIEKACNYLFSHMGLFVTFFDDDIVEDIERSEFIKKFRIAMEE
jgi:hypothetical protein